MPLLPDDQTRCHVQGAIVAWDGVTAPEVRDDGSKSHKLKIIIPANSPDIAVVDALARDSLQSSKWRGSLPNGGLWAITPIGPGEYNDAFPGGFIVNPGTKRFPEVWDDAQQQITNEQHIAGLLYQGQVVDVILNCFPYDNKSKGIGTGLDSIMIHVSKNAPRQNFSSGGYNSSSVFGGGAPQQGQAPAQQGGYGQAPQQGQAPAQQGGYGGAPQQGQAPAQQGGYGGAPQQAAGYLPQ